MTETLPIAYLRIWAQKNQMVVEIERNSSDKYIISNKGVFLVMPDGEKSQVNPRQVFTVVDRYPSLIRSDLRILGSTPTREFYLRASCPGDRSSAKFVTLDQVFEEVESYLSLLMHLDPVQLYVAIRSYENGLVGLPHINRVAGMLTPQVTMGTLLIRENLCNWEDLLSVCLDLKKSNGSAKAADVSEFELSGEILIALGCITRTQLQQAMKIKSSGDRPLGEILVEMKVCEPCDIENAMRAQTEMRNTEYGAIGLLGELLVEGGYVRNEDVFEALRMQKIGRQRLDGIFVSMGICTPEHIQEFRWRCPGAMLPTGEINEDKLGDWAVMRDFCTPKQLEEAQRLQKRGRQLLGELLVNLKHCTQKDIEAALDAQRLRRQMKPKDPDKIGELLVSRRVVDQKSLQQASEIQRAGRQQIGSTLVNLGACTQDDFGKALELQFSWRQSAKSREDKLGDELLREGNISPQNLSRALEIHSKAGKPLGQILIDSGSCTPETVIDTLVRRDERRRTAFGLMVKQQTMMRQPKAASALRNAEEPEPEKAGGLVDKVSSWLFRKPR